MCLCVDVNKTSIHSVCTINHWQIQDFESGRTILGLRSIPPAGLMVQHMLFARRDRALQKWEYIYKECSESAKRTLHPMLYLFLMSYTS